MYFFLFINFLISLWVYYDSQKNGYTVWKGFLWAVGVFFLLFIFLPMYLFSRNKRKKLSFRRNAPSSSLLPCFYCGRVYEGDPRVCPHCGQNLDLPKS